MFQTSFGWTKKSEGGIFWSSRFFIESSTSVNCGPRLFWNRAVNVSARSSAFGFIPNIFIPSGAFSGWHGGNLMRSLLFSLYSDLSLKFSVEVKRFHSACLWRVGSTVASWCQSRVVSRPVVVS